MQGIELAKAYFSEYGLPMLQKEFEDILPFLAVGLCGSGSECYGYDDDISQDHDFEPGFCIFVPDGLDRKREFQLERAYAKLPKEFMGIKRSPMQAVGGNRHGVLHYTTFFKEKTGTEDGKLSLEDWFTVPEFALLEATNGEIFLDNLGAVTQIRENIKAIPQDVRLKKLAGHLLNMAQAGQYNYMRCVRRGESGAAQLAIFEFVKSAIQVIFLLNQSYMPYYKWMFRALRTQNFGRDLALRLENLLYLENNAELAEQKAKEIENLASVLIAEVKKQGYSHLDSNELERQAYAVNDEIADVSIRNAHILMAL